MPETPAPPTESPFLTVEEVATVLRISTKTVRRLIEDGELPVTNAGRRLLVPRSAIDDRIERAQAEAAERSERTA
ncbi:MAG: helix-turn-helix domain-containing protein [Acidimicrobiia bacterium]